MDFLVFIFTNLVLALRRSQALRECSYIIANESISEVLHRSDGFYEFEVSRGDSLRILPKYWRDICVASDEGGLSSRDSRDCVLDPIKACDNNDDDDNDHDGDENGNDEGLRRR